MYWLYFFKGVLGIIGFVIVFGGLLLGIPKLFDKLKLSYGQGLLVIFVTMLVVYVIAAGALYAHFKMQYG